MAEGAPRAVFITLEGGEGTGKSTQSRRLAARLRAAGRDVVETREPGGSPGAEAVRHVLLSGAAKPLGPAAEALLFAAARADHVDSVIRPALTAGKSVICDRFVDSTRIYQGVLGEVPASLLDQLEQLVTVAARPDLTLVLDVPPQVGLARAGARDKGVKDRFEQEGAAYHAKVREAFLALAAADPTRCAVVDATGDVDEVAEAVARIVVERLGLAFAPDGATASVP